VRTIAKAAPFGELDDVSEALLCPTRILDEPELSHTGRVDQETSLGHLDELTTGRRMLPFSIVAKLSHLLRSTTS
jgi:hypothetical protein